MSVKIDKYKLIVKNTSCQIVDKSYYKDKAIITFHFENNDLNKRLAEACLDILNTGKYEEVIEDE